MPQINYTGENTLQKALTLVKTALFGKYDKTGGNISGDVDVDGDVSLNIPDDDYDVSITAHAYLDNNRGTVVNLSGDASGTPYKVVLENVATPQNNYEAANKAYVDAHTQIWLTGVMDDDGSNMILPSNTYQKCNEAVTTNRACFLKMVSPSRISSFRLKTHENYNGHAHTVVVPAHQQNLTQQRESYLMFSSSQFNQDIQDAIEAGQKVSLNIPYRIENSGGVVITEGTLDIVLDDIPVGLDAHDFSIPNGGGALIRITRMLQAQYEVREVAGNYTETSQDVWYVSTPSYSYEVGGTDTFIFVDESDIDKEKKITVSQSANTYSEAELEKTDNKVITFDGTITNTQYPSALLVLNGFNYCAANYARKPVVVWEETTPANYLKAVNTDLSASPAWQLTNLDLTPYKRIKIYSCAGQKSGATASASTTPAIVLEMSLDSRNAISAYGNNYVASVMVQKPNDANRLASLTCAVSADKTKFVVLRQTSLYGTAATSNNDVNANVFMIEGYYD